MASSGSSKGVVLLLGAPGTGKSLLGNALAMAHRSITSFVNVGETLVVEGLVGAHLAHPTPTNQAALRSRARSILEGACASLQSKPGRR